MTTDYQRIAHQVTGQVQAIERADASEQRLLALELAHILAQWEAAQTETLLDQDGLLRAAHLANLAQTTAQQAAAMVTRLSEKKAKLRQTLQDNAEQLRQRQTELESLRVEVERLSQELSVQESCLSELAAREAELHKQQAACEQLRGYQSRHQRIQTELAELRAALHHQDPAPLLQQLAELQHSLLSDYQAYLLASQDITTQMHDTQAGSLPPGPELLNIPERLIRLDAELKAIDQILAEHLRQQDAQDAEVRTRV